MGNKTMTITDISKTSKQFKDTHTLQVGGFVDGGDGRITLKSINNKLDLFISEQREMWKHQQNFNKLILDRLENLISKNNLKE